MQLVIIPGFCEQNFPNNSLCSNHCDLGEDLLEEFWKAVFGKFGHNSYLDRILPIRGNFEQTLNAEHKVDSRENVLNIARFQSRLDDAPVLALRFLMF